MNSEFTFTQSLPTNNMPPDKAKIVVHSMEKPKASIHAPKTSGTYATLAKSSIVTRRFYSSAFQHAVRVDFTNFYDKSTEAKEAFGKVFEDVQPENNRKHPLREAY
jgi:hypothetical protein